MKLKIKAYLSKADFFKLPSGEQRKKAEKYEVYKKYLKEAKEQENKKKAMQKRFRDGNPKTGDIVKLNEYHPDLGITKKQWNKIINDGKKKSEKSEKFDYYKTASIAYKRANIDAKKLRKLDSEEARDKEVAKIAKKMPKPKSIQEAISSMLYLKQLADASDIYPQGKYADNSYNAIHDVYDKAADAIGKKYGIHPANMYRFDSLEELQERSPDSKKIQNLSQQDYDNILAFNDAVDTISEDYGGW